MFSPYHLVFILEICWQLQFLSLINIITFYDAGIVYVCTYSTYISVGVLKRAFLEALKSTVILMLVF